MTITVASIFLPYTVRFTDANQNDAKSTPDVLPATPPSSDDSEPDDSLALSVIGSPILSSNDNDGTANNHEDSLTPRYVASRLPILLRGVSEPSSFPTSGSQTDLHTPAWGADSDYNQPLSRAKSPPPASILRDIKTRTRTTSFLLNEPNKAKSPGKFTGIDNTYTEDNFIIEPAHLGNAGLWTAINAATKAELLEEKTWVGTIGSPIDALAKHVKSAIAEKLDADHQALAVLVDDTVLYGHYEHYCKVMLWPLLHYQLPDEQKSLQYYTHSWELYVKVNKTFADTIAKNYKRGDTIWIHDYHLFLVPEMLRKMLPDAPIGFFLHTPFPSSEVFRALVPREEVLMGILGANLVGFQTEDYCYHFAQACSGILNVEATTDKVILQNGRMIHVEAFPMGIDTDYLDRGLKDPLVRLARKQILEHYKGKRIIFSRDKFDNVRGIEKKLLAYERFLKTHAQYRHKVVLIQVATSTTENAAYRTSIDKLVGDINSKYSTLAHQAVVFLQSDIDHFVYLAMLSLADCLMITSLRDGMNLTSHEFIYCQNLKTSEEGPGCLILSEFTGSSTLFSKDHAIKVNPYNATECASAIKEALGMPISARKARWRGLSGVIANTTATSWFSLYKQHLEAAWKDNSIRDRTTIPRLSYNALEKAYKNAGKRLIILNYENTLASWGRPNETILTNPKLANDTLNELLDDSKNTVYVMSSGMPYEMDILFLRVPGLGLIAENGCFLRPANLKMPAWTHLADLEEADKWKDSVRPVLTYYSARLAGSAIDERNCSLTLKFEKVDGKNKADARNIAGECVSDINNNHKNLPVRAVPVADGLHISFANINRATAAKHISKDFGKVEGEGGIPVPDFLLVIGCTRDDECIFEWAHDMKKKGIRDVVTVTLSDKNTQASATLTPGVHGKFNCYTFST